MLEVFYTSKPLNASSGQLEAPAPVILQIFDDVNLKADKFDIGTGEET